MATNRPYLLHEDLVARAVPTLDQRMPIVVLLQEAESCARNAEKSLAARDIDFAYVDYLKAFDIVVNIVPHHEDFPSLNLEHGELWKRKRELQNWINSQHRVFDEVRDIIKSDNARRKASQAAADGRQPQETLFYEGSSIGVQSFAEPRAPYDGPNAIEMPGGAYTERLSSQCTVRLSGMDEDVSFDMKRRGQENGLQDADLQPVLAGDEPGRNGEVSHDTLAERFSMLRATEPTRSKATHEQVKQQMNGKPSPVSSNSPLPPLVGPFKHSAAPNGMQTSVPPSVQGALAGPKGPREMPVVANGLPRPPKLAVKSDVYGGLPRPPSPTYSPARNVPEPATIEPPRSTPRSMFGTGGRSSSLASTTIPHRIPDSLRPYPAPLDDNDARRREPSGERTIKAEELYHQFKRGSENLSILFIDVRDRTAFDSGHIFAPSIICIEPFTIRPQVSAADIEEAMVLSPETEERLFQHRDKFDLVVYYDQSSDTEVSGSADSQNSETLASLRRALTDFCFERRLKEPPALLAGGLDAWTDLMGTQALQISDTIYSPDRRRINMTKHLGSAVHSHKAIHSTAQSDKVPAIYNHLNDRGSRSAEELCVDGIGLDSHSRGEAGVGRAHQAHSRQAPTALLKEEGRQYIRTYDEFLRRFPEASDVKASMSTVSPVLEQTAIGDRQRQPPRPGPVARLPISGSPSRPPPALPRQSYSGVSEHGAYQAPVPPNPPPVAAAAVRPSSADSISARPPHQPGRTGLTNFGATCYMNAVVQCLSATTPLTRYFLDGSYQGALQPGNTFGSKGKLPGVYANLVRQLWSGNYIYVTPKTIREAVSHLNQEFENPDVQHDAHDFFVFILDCLHEDLNTNYGRTRLNELTPAEERRRERMPPHKASHTEWLRWSHRNTSRISTLFGGQYMSRLRCPVCGCTSTSYETFFSIALEIPRPGAGGGGGGSSSSSSGGRARGSWPSVYDCLRNYTREERLGPADPWTCPTCRESREASKQLTITRAPPILVLQLKRFRSVRRGCTDKNGMFVDFPLTGLNLTPFALPVAAAAPSSSATKTAAANDAIAAGSRPSGAGSAATAMAGAANGTANGAVTTAGSAMNGSAMNGAASAAAASAAPPAQRIEYNAFAVVNHFGSLHGGHYTALIRDRSGSAGAGGGGGGGGHWLEYNDRSVNSFPAHKVPSAAAYLLFYERVSPPA